MESADGITVLASAAGNMQPDTPFYIASINKLFLSAITLRQCTEGKLSLEDKISLYLQAELMQGLHVHKG